MKTDFHFGKNLTASDSNYLLLDNESGLLQAPVISCHEFLVVFMHFCPGTMTPHVELINSDLQHELDRR